MAAKKVTRDKDKIISYLTLRKAIGWLGMLLPFILILGTLFINKVDILNNSCIINTACSKPYTEDGIFKISISRYYYGAAGELFTAILCSFALFLFCYKGHPKRKYDIGLSDDGISNLAGICALGVVLFPTGTDECLKDNIRTFLISRHAGVAHYISATMFFISLALMLILNFRRGNKKEDFGKGKYHGFYLFCGIAMLVCIILIPVYAMFVKGSWDSIDRLNPVFWLEALALIFFGIAWLKKGRADFCYIPRLLSICK